jgi:hypothetical protein
MSKINYFKVFLPFTMLNYDPNSLKVAKLVSEAEARHREAWVGVN